jgi:ATPase subunit of ABC transporter with duplicated ATPase domains
MEAIRANRVIRFKFPDPDIVCLRLSTSTSPILTLAKCQIGWDAVSSDSQLEKGSGEVILDDVTLQLTMKSRIAIVGPNGQGKSTLIAALMQAVNGDVLYPDTTSPSILRSLLSRPKQRCLIHPYLSSAEKLTAITI